MWYFRNRVTIDVHRKSYASAADDGASSIKGVPFFSLCLSLPCKSHHQFERSLSSSLHLSLSITITLMFLLSTFLKWILFVLVLFLQWVRMKATVLVTRSDHLMPIMRLKQMKGADGYLLSGVDASRSKRKEFYERLLLPMKHVSPLHVTGVVQGKVRDQYKLAPGSSQALPKWSWT